MIAFALVIIVPVSGCSADRTKTPYHEPHMWIDNYDSVEHTININITTKSGEQVLRKSETLSASEEADYENILPRLTEEEISYRISVYLDNGKSESNTITVSGGSGFYALSVSIEENGEIRITEVVS